MTTCAHQLLFISLSLCAATKCSDEFVSVNRSSRGVVELPNDCEYDHALVNESTVDFFLFAHSSFVRCATEMNGFETSVLMDNEKIVGYGMRILAIDKEKGGRSISKDVNCNFDPDSYSLTFVNSTEKKNFTPYFILSVILVVIAGTFIAFTTCSRSTARNIQRRPEVVGTEQKKSPRVVRKEICESYIEV